MTIYNMGVYTRPRPPTRGENIAAAIRCGQRLSLTGEMSDPPRGVSPERWGGMVKSVMGGATTQACARGMLWDE